MKKSYLVIVGVLFFVLFYLLNLSKIASSSKLTSPLMASGKASLNLWIPKVLGIDYFDTKEQITASAAYFVEITSGETVFEKNPHQKMPIASLNKIMTAIIALENEQSSFPSENEVWQREIVISERAANVEPDKMLLIAGEKLTVEELIYGMFLISANDAAEALAEESTGSRDEFISLMNQKAKQIGMINTKFVNPTGLDEDPSTLSGQVQYSTSYDVALMSRYLIKTFPHILDITSTYHKFIPATYKHQDYDMYSGINLLTTYDGVIGLKTGFTLQAGYTLVTLANRSGKIVLGVLLNSNSRRDEAKILLDYSFSRFGLTN